MRLFFFIIIRLFSTDRTNLVLENLALRQQVIVYERTLKGRKKKIRNRDRVFWVILSKLWRRWKESLVLVKPETVIAWHRKAFKVYWRWKSNRPGRPKIDKETIALIKQMSSENPRWGEDRIQGELIKLGIRVAPSTIRKYMIKNPKPPSQTWKTFLKNHAGQIWACDFFTVPTISFKVLYAFFFIAHDRRTILYVNVTEAPSQHWTAQQFINAIFDNEPPRFLIRDRDNHFGDHFKRRTESCGTKNLLGPPRAPKFNAIAERVVRTFRRECTDRMIILNETHLRMVLKEYVAFYNHHRPHQEIDQQIPIQAEDTPPKDGNIVSVPVLNGVQHYYERVAA